MTSALERIRAKAKQQRAAQLASNKKPVKPKEVKKAPPPKKACTGNGDKKEIAEKSARARAAALTKKATTVNYEVPEEARNIEGFDADEFLTTLKELEDSVSAKASDMDSLMAKIHRNLKQYPELCHILSDDLIKVAVSGFLIQANIETTTKRRTSQKKAETKAKASVEDLLDSDFDF